MTFEGFLTLTFQPNSCLRRKIFFTTSRYTYFGNATYKGVQSLLINDEDELISSFVFHFTVVQNGYPFKPKLIILLGTSRVVSYVITIFKMLLKEKIRKRVC